MEYSNSRKGSEVVLEIILLLEREKHLTFSQIKNQLNINSNSLTRHLKTLQEKGFLIKSQKNYLLRARNNSSSTNISVIAPLIKIVKNFFNATTMYISYDCGQMVCKNKASTEDGLELKSIGNISTNYICNPWGHLLIHESDKKHREYLIKKSDLTLPTSIKVPSKELVYYLINQIDKKGYGDDLGKIIPHIRRLAFPIYDNNILVGSVAVGMYINQHQDSIIESYSFKTLEHINHLFEERNK